MIIYSQFKGRMFLRNCNNHLLTLQGIITQKNFLRREGLRSYTFKHDFKIFSQIFYCGIRTRIILSVFLALYA